MLLNGYEFYRTENAELVSVSGTAVSFPEHCHSADFVITIVTKGSAVLERSGTVRTIHENGVFVLPPYEAHSLISAGPVSMLTLCIKKQAVYLSDHDDLLELTDPVLSKADLSSDLIDIFRENILRIYESFHIPPQDSADIFSLSLAEIEKDPESDRSVDSLASEIYVSKFHYIRKFRELYGLTPHKFRLQSRIRKAQKMLLSGSSVADTAVMTGFFDQSHFDKYFRRIVGLSPVEYIGSVSNFLQSEV